MPAAVEKTLTVETDEQNNDSNVGKLPKSKSPLKKPISVEEFEEKNLLISSPRSLEACLRTGFDPQSLMPRL